MNWKKILKPTKRNLVISILIIIIGFLSHLYVQSFNESTFVINPVPIHEALFLGINNLVLFILIIIGLPGFLISSYFSEIFFNLPTIGFIQSGIILFALNLIYIYLIASIIANKTTN